MKYGSVCSGIEAATVAWHELGWEPQWFSEIEKFPSAVLNHQYPNVPNLGDMTKFKEWKDAKPIDILVGGTPCQSFSVAGLRKGLEDPRGNLMLTYLAMAAQFKPKWVIWENVPGVLSSNGGRDFGTFLGSLGEIGYGWAYRVLDAQYFGVPQRRRRVFVVGCLGDWRSAGEVLFEPESVSGHPAPIRKKRKEVADCITVGANQYSGFNGEPVEDAGYASTVGTLCARTGLSNSVQDAGQGHLIVDDDIVTSHMGFDSYNQAVTGDVAKTLNTGSGYDQVPNVLTTKISKKQQWPADTTATLNASFGDKMGLEDQHINGGASMFVPIAFGSQNSSRQGDGVSIHVTPTLDTSKTPSVLLTSKVRRLTPIECERLQGFPDNYTEIAYGKKTEEDCPVGPRYKSLGNSMAVPVMKWIGGRIAQIDTITNESKRTSLTKAL